MKHIFVINPAAGKESAVEKIQEKLKRLDALHLAEFYITKAPNDATEFVRSRCLESPNESLRFYACGGDGTIEEVVSGMVGFENAELSCYPCGSGNDYVKYYGGADAFLDLDNLINSEAAPVDLMKVCGKYCINVCNFGFEAIVAKTMAKVRRKFLIGGKNAYTTGIVKAVFSGMKNKCTVIADGEVLNPDGNMLLCSVANGQYVGGSYKCAPRSINNDGLLEVCLVRPISLPKFLSLISIYEKGQHIGNPKFKDIIVYRRAKHIEVHPADAFDVCIDGEITESRDFIIDVVPGAVKFAAPVKVAAMV